MRQAFKPGYAKASNIAKSEGLDVVLAAVYCTENEDVCAKYQVKGYPTVVWFKGSVTDAIVSR